MAGDTGRFVYVHVRFVKARGVQALPERGRQRRTVQRAVGDDRGGDAILGLPDLIFDYARRLYHHCPYHERVDGDGTVADISSARPSTAACRYGSPSAGWRMKRSVSS